MTTLTVLIEDSKPEGSLLIAEHGLIFLLETKLSYTGAAFDNAKVSGVDLSDIK